MAYTSHVRKRGGYKQKFIAKGDFAKGDFAKGDFAKGDFAKGDFA